MTPPPADAPRPTSRTCAGCAHWLRLPASASARSSVVGPVGECHALPPSEHYRWPRTEESGWCGRFLAPARQSKRREG